jgi:histone-lysine N-methyltransferase SETMAR
LKDSTIYKYITLARCGTEEVSKKSPPGRTPDDGIDKAILYALSIEPFASVRRIDDMTNIHYSTVYRHLTFNLGMIYKRTKWVPHKLSQDDKGKRVELAIALKDRLIKQRRQGWRNLITGDESWFLYSYAFKGKWCLIDDTNPKAVCQKNSWNKNMVTIFWSVFGFHVVDVLPQGESFNSSYFCANIISPLAEQKDSYGYETHRRKVHIHFDNCKVHRSKKSTQCIDDNGFKKVPHPAYSPDLAPSDFFLFGYTKHMLSMKKYEGARELKDEITIILSDIPVELLRRVFDEWITRCDSVISSGGCYCD